MEVRNNTFPEENKLRLAHMYVTYHIETCFPLIKICQKSIVIGLLRNLNGFLRLLGLKCTFEHLDMFILLFRDFMGNFSDTVFLCLKDRSSANFPR